MAKTTRIPNRSPMTPGHRFGRLVSVKFLRRDKHHNQTWLFQCDCGREHEAFIGSVRFGAIQSCGCFHRERMTKHGMSRTRIYHIWAGMVSRCSNEKTPEYQDYGARGIKVCERWLKFENFFADMGERTSPKHTLERSNNNGNYEPSNCRWATWKEQASNRRNSRIVTLNGRKMTLSEAKRLLIRGG